MHLTYAPWGGSFSINFFRFSAAYILFNVGGNLNDTLTLVSVLKTLPATSTFGKPSIPIYANYAFQFLFIIDWKGSVNTVCIPSAKG